MVYGGDTHSLIPLYMIGMFVSFTISQAGMVAHWRRLRAPAWRTSAWINGLGSAVTGVVLVVVAVTKAHEGAWLVLVLIPMHVLFFVLTRRHYEQVATQLSLKGWTPSPAHRNRVVVPIGGVHRAVVQSVEYAKSLSSDVRGVRGHRSRGHGSGSVRMADLGQGVPLVVLESPYRSLMEPLLEYVDRLEAECPDDFVTVVLPEFVPARWWHRVFHNQRALLIKGALLFTRHIVVTSVPFHLSR